MTASPTSSSSSTFEWPNILDSLQQKLAQLVAPTAEKPTTVDKDVALAMHHGSGAFIALLAGVYVLSQPRVCFHFENARACRLFLTRSLSFVPPAYSASDVCREDQRVTLTGTDVMKALDELGMSKISTRCVRSPADSHASVRLELGRV